MPATSAGMTSQTLRGLVSNVAKVVLLANGGQCSRPTLGPRAATVQSMQSCVCLRVARVTSFQREQGLCWLAGLAITQKASNTLARVCIFDLAAEVARE